MRIQNCSISASIVVRTQPSITEAAILAMIERALAQQPRTDSAAMPMDRQRRFRQKYVGGYTVSPLGRPRRAAFSAVYPLYFVRYISFVFF